MIEEIKRDGRPGSSAIWLAGQHDSHPNQPKQQETISKGYESCSQTFRRLWPLAIALAVVALLGLAARLLQPIDDCRDAYVTITTIGEPTSSKMCPIDQLPDSCSDLDPVSVEIGSTVHLAGCRP